MKIRTGGLVSFILALSIGIAALSGARANPAVDDGDRATAARSMVALVIGNQRYDAAELESPARDARAVAALLGEMGAEVMLRENLSQAGMQQAFEAFAARLATGGRTGLFYFAGHGFRSGGTNYLLPVDADVGTAAAARAASLELDTLFGMLAQTPHDGPTIVLLDSCRNDPFAGAGPATRSSAAADPADRIPADFLVAYGAAPGGVAVDGPGGHGVFTAELLAAMTRPDLDLAGAFQNAARAVAVRTEGRQAPQIVTTLSVDVRLPESASATRTAMARLAAPGKRLSAQSRARGIKSTRESQAAEMAFWDAIKSSTDPQDYRAYLEAFPNGSFAPLARIRVKKYEEPAPAAPVKPAVASPPPVKAKPAGAAVAKISRAASGPFKDCTVCPEMVRLPAKSYVMGSRSGDASERPAHKVTIRRPFALGRYEVTVAQWMACVAADGCHYEPKAAMDPKSAPVYNLSWDDAQQYVQWLRQVTGQPYRLPSEAEWEFAARAGTSSDYWWGDAVAANLANCKGCGEPWSRHAPSSVGQYEPNPFGLHDMNGGVAEWTGDCWFKDFAGAPADGSARNKPNCRQRVLKGGSWRNGADYLRSAARNFYDASVRYKVNGLRVAVPLQ